MKAPHGSLDRDLSQWIEESTRRAREFAEEAPRIVANGVPEMESVMAHQAETARLLAGLGGDLTRELERAARSFEPFFKQVQKTLEGLPDRTRAALAILARNGWWLDMTMDLRTVAEVADMFAAGRDEVAHERLADHFRARSDAIERELTNGAPSRAVIIRKAFAAHRRGDFELSIPVLLAQADGLCFEEMHVSVYAKKKGTPIVADHLPALPLSSLVSVALSPLTEATSINESAWDDRPPEADLNRHRVLHGRSVDYGSEMNGLRAISFLYYVWTVVLLTRKHEGSERRSSPT